MKISNIFSLFLIVFSTVFFARAQAPSPPIKGKVETLVKSPPKPEAAANCALLKIGSLLALSQPEYLPAAKSARVGGTVRVDLKLSEKGSFSEILAVSGNNLLHAAATKAARRVKFSPTVCDGKPVSTAIVLFYNFIPYAADESYSTPTKIEDFADAGKDSEFYEPLLNLTENYRLAFGYADRKFHANAPLTRGDFAEFLRRTLDLLAERARAAGKLPHEINLFYPLNPQNLKSADGIKNLDKKAAYIESFKTLLLTYDIALTDEKQEFSGRNVLTRVEVNRLWTSIFTAEAVPVNFALGGGIGDERIMTRGEFALFLRESLDVLTYKTLP